MSRMTMDLNTLAQETLELSQNIRANMGSSFLDAHQGEFIFEDAFDFSFEDEDSEERTDSQEYGEEIASDSEESKQYEGVGLLFKVEKGLSTFCIRAVVSEDLAWDFEALEKGDRSLTDQLKLQEGESVCAFTCPDLAVASTIHDQMINRRFPRQEAILCNLSDPGFSWWMEEQSQELSIYFQSHGIERDDSLIQLGPLGDPMIASHRLSKSLAYLKSSFPVNEFSATSKAFSISAAGNGHIRFESFKKLFIEGDDDFLNDGQLEVNDPTLTLYLRELAALRRFWLVVSQSHL